MRIRVKTKGSWPDPIKVRDILEESPVCRWIMERGFERGFEQGFEQGRRQALQHGRQIFVRYVQKRFPVLGSLAEERAAQMEDFEVLNDTLDAVDDAETIEEVRRILEEGVRPDAAN